MIGLSVGRLAERGFGCRIGECRPDPAPSSGAFRLVSVLEPLRVLRRLRDHFLRTGRRRAVACSPRALQHAQWPRHFVILADDLVILMSDQDSMSFLPALDRQDGPADWQVPAVNDLSEACHASPATSASRLNVRTATALCAFARSQ